MIDGTIKLADFGLTKELHPNGGTSYAMTAVGTKIYMAPEVFAGTRYAKDADIFSLGILLN